MSRKPKVLPNEDQPANIELPAYSMMGIVCQWPCSASSGAA
jgi:hypothetical protein